MAAAPRMCSSMNVSKSKPSFTATAQKEDVLRSMTAACRQRWSRRNWWRKRDPASKPDNKISQEFKFLLPKPEPQWPPPMLPFSAPALLDGHGVLLDPEKTLEETQQFLERTVSGGKNWPVFIKTEQDPESKIPLSRPHPDAPNAGRNNLTGLMAKNNVSVPLDCTTKVVGFKMVDGKKHIVLKVIPSNQQDCLGPKNSKSVESGSCGQTAGDQRTEQNQSNDVLTSNVSRNSDFLHSVAERRNGQQGLHRQLHTDAKTHISSSAGEMKLKAAQSHRSTKEPPLRCCVTSEFTSPSLCREGSNIRRHTLLSAGRIKVRQEKTLRDSQENFTTSQGDFGCHSDQAQRCSLDTGFLEERCHSLFLTQRKEQNSALSSVNAGTANTDSCPESRLISNSDCFRSASRFPRKDLTESLHHLECEVGDVLLHSGGDGSTNNTHPRGSPLPADESDCEMLPAELYQTADERLLDGVAAGLRLSLDPSDETHTEDSGEHSRTELSVPLNQSALSQKRVVEVLLCDSREPVSKSQKPSGPEESDIIAPVLHWESVPRDVPRTLRLSPYCSSQPIKVPHGKQPVVVLNHPDTEVPEVTNIMRVVHKHRGAVQRVVLSRKTLQALSEFHCDVFQKNCTADCHAPHCRRVWPNATANERFSLKLRLKRVCGRKYTVVPSALESIAVQPTFRCWFCGRLFRNQEVWVGHGQRHLMEATRGWKQLLHRAAEPFLRSAENR